MSRKSKREQALDRENEELINAFKIAIIPDNDDVAKIGSLEGVSKKKIGNSDADLVKRLKKLGKMRDEGSVSSQECNKCLKIIQKLKDIMKNQQKLEDEFRNTLGVK